MTPTEYFKWWTVDERTGERRTTTYKLSRADAKRTFPGARPVLETREIRYLSDPADPPSMAKPPSHFREDLSDPEVRQET